MNADTEQSRPDPGTITHLLDRGREGDDDALAEVWTLLYHELRRVAHGLMQGEGLAQQVDATELIGEIWMRGKKDNQLPSDRKQFFGRAFRHMAQELVERARKRDALKRGGGWQRTPLDIATGELSTLDTFDDDQKDAAAALMGHWQSLNEDLPETGNVAFCRLVLGLTNDETALTLGLDTKAARREWEFARARLGVAMSASQGQ